MNVDWALFGYVGPSTMTLWWPLVGYVWRLTAEEDAYLRRMDDREDRSERETGPGSHDDR